MKVSKVIAGFFHKTHPYRAAFWPAMVPVVIAIGWQDSVFVIFLYSTYANFAADVAAWEGSTDDQS